MRFFNFGRVMRFIFFLLIPIVLLSDKIETFYGILDIEEPVILEIIQSETFQRLRFIHQYGVTYYDKTHDEEYNRFEHSLGVFAILRLKGCSLEEQIAGLLHDVSHTVFSHVGDFVFEKQGQEKDYQNSIHQKFLEDTRLADILSKYGYKVENMLPLKELFPALEQPLPDLCADRIDYNIQGAYYKGFITKQEAYKILEDIQFEDNRWVSSDENLMSKLVIFSLFMTKNCWGGVNNFLSSRCLADILLKALEIGIISLDDIHYGTDEIIWEKLQSSKDSFIVNKMKALLSFDTLYRIVGNNENFDFHIKSKFRGIDPWINHNNKIERLTKIDSDLANIYNIEKNEIQKGWLIKFF